MVGAIGELSGGGRASGPGVGLGVCSTASIEHSR